MIFTRKSVYAVILLFILSSCGTYFNQPITRQEARIGEENEVTKALKEFPLPQKPVVAGVYNFKDQTGQYKAVENGSTFSTAVSQGATTILIKALEDSKWFTPIERENLGNLLNERNIIRSTRDEYRKNKNPNEPQLPPLLYAGILLEGGVISYDTNIVTGGSGARYFGTGVSSQYRQDRITVYLRAVSTSSGKILKTVYISKTILSQAVSANLFKYVNFQRLLEAEVGFTKNEPVQLALKESIEKAVEALIIEGIKDNLWKPQLNEKETKALVEAYEAEEEEANATALYDRYLTERRSKVAFTGALGTTLMDGDLPNAQPEFNSRSGFKFRMSPSLNFNTTYYKFNLSNKEFLNEGYMSLDFNLEYIVLPQDQFTPLLYLGGGVNAANYLTSVDPKFQAGIGLEYLLSKKLGLHMFVDYNYVFSDELDFIDAGKRSDTYYRAGIGINYYFSKRKNKKLDEGKLEELRVKRELKEIRKKNRAKKKARK